MLSQSEIEKIKSVVSSKKGLAYAILFGSALRRLFPHSDIDLMIGGELTPLEKIDLSMELTVELGRQIDVISSGEGRCEVVLKAFSSGVLIFIRDRGCFKKDYLKNFHLCDQKNPLRRIRLERLKRVYGNG